MHGAIYVRMWFHYCYCSEKAIAVTDHFQKLPVLPAKKLILGDERGCVSIVPRLLLKSER